MMITSTRAFLRTIVLVIAMNTSIAVAATINIDTVLGPGHPFPNETITVVDGADPPTNVDILDGAVIGGQPGQFAVPTGLDAYGESVVTMFGGIIVGAQQAVRLNDHSLFRMLDGEIDTRHIESRDNSRVVLDAGRWNSVFAYENSRVVVNGGIFAETYSVRTFGHSHTVLNGAFLTLVADEQCTAVVNGGVFEHLLARGNAEVLVNGGSYVVGLGAAGNAVVRLRSVDDFAEEPLVARDNGVIHIYGTGLEFKVIDDHGTLRNIVAGRLADGDNFGARYRLFGNGQIILHEVPEPGSWALLVVGALGVCLARRRSRNSAG